MRELFRIPRMGVPAWTRRTVSLALAGVIVTAAVITPGVSVAAKVFTLKKAEKISLGNTIVVSVQGSAAPQVSVPVTLLCPPGHQATSGGMDSPTLAGTDPDGFPWALVSVPVAAGSRSVGWYLEVYNQGTVAKPFTAYAVCAP
jgi:hypothetical protein